MKNLFGILILGLLAVAALSRWPQAEAGNKFANQASVGLNGSIEKTTGPAAEFPQKISFVMGNDVEPGLSSDRM